MMLDAGGSAAFVYGQPDLTTAGSATTSVDSCSPIGVAVAPSGSALFVADYYNNRVLFYPPLPPTANQPNAVDVLGQPNFGSSGFGVGIYEMHYPTALVYDEIADTLWVTDLKNNRVQRFDSVLIPVQSVGSLDVSFQGRSPSVYLYPKGKPLRFAALTNSCADSSGVAKPGVQQALLQPDRIEEIDSSGAVVATVALPSNGYNWTLSSDASNNQQFIFSLTTPSSVCSPWLAYLYYKLTGYASFQRLP